MASFIVRCIMPTKFSGPRFFLTGGEDIDEVRERVQARGWRPWNPIEERPNTFVNATQGVSDEVEILGVAEPFEELPRPDFR